jgi:hypothetical protein
MKQQTAVTWLLNNLKGQLNIDEVSNIIDQAKAMEKEQIKDAYFNSASDILCIPNGIKENAEKYYNETYEN